MKSLLVSLLIVGVLLVMYLRPWSGGQPPGGQPTVPTERFMRQCVEVFAGRAKPEVYCRCLWAKGVHNPADTLSKAAARAAAKACGR